MKKSIVFGLILLSFTSSFAYVEFSGEEFSCKPEFDYYSRNWLGADIVGRGGTGVGFLGSVTNTILNPAAFWLNDKFEAYYEFSAKSGAIYDKYFEFSPQASGIFLSIGKQLSDYVNMGLIYYRPHSYKLNFGILNLYTPWGLVSDEWVFQRTTTTVSIPINFTYDEKLFLGTSINISVYEGYRPYIVYTSLAFEITRAEISAMVFQPMFGVLYKFNESLSVGASFLCSAKKEVYFKIENSTNGSYDANHFPLKLSAGVSYSFQKLPLNLFADLSFEDTGKYDELHNKTDFALGCEYVWNYFTFRAGMQTLYNNRDLDATFVEGETTYYFWWDRKAYNLNFLTSGVQFNYKIFQIQSAFISSKLSDKDYGHNQFSVGAGIRF